MTQLALYVFGPPRIEYNDEAIDIDRRKAIALVVYLTVTGQSHSRDALATFFWPEYDRSRARAALRRVLWELNNALGKHWLEVDRESVALRRTPEFWLDMDQFHRRLAEYRTHDHPEEVCATCLALLVEAVELYRDDFLAGFTLRDSPAFDEWQFFQTEQLRREFASILERLVRHHSTQGEFETAIAYARRWLALDPLHEPAHRHLIQLYTWSGQRAAAMRQYSECSRILQKELGITPQEATTQLYATAKKAPHRVAYLRLVSGPGAPAGERFVLGETTTIGYGRRTNDIHLGDGYVSKRHARIEHKGGLYRLRDLRSTNGTYLNGAQIEPDKLHLLTPGDEIKIGETRLVFEYAETKSLGGPDEIHETLRM